MSAPIASTVPIRSRPIQPPVPSKCIRRMPTDLQIAPSEYVNYRLPADDCKRRQRPVYRLKASCRFSMKAVPASRLPGVFNPGESGTGAARGPLFARRPGLLTA